MHQDIRVERAEIDEAVEGRTLCGAFARTVERLGEAPALSWPEGDDTAVLTWGEYAALVRRFALGLRAAGLRRGEFVAIMVGNRPEHVIADLGAVHAGAVPVSVYTTSSPDQLAYVLGHCEATVAVVENEAFLERLRALHTDLPRLRTVVVVDSPAGGVGEVLSWDDLLALGDQGQAAADQFEAMAGEVRPDDLATVVYTSGTTGPPKGVGLSHRNVLWTMETISRAVTISSDDSLISYLPLAHALERWWSHWNSAVHGLRVTFCPDRLQLLAALRGTRPAWFIGVPRVWERLRAGILAGVAAEGDPARRQAAQTAIDVGRQVVTRQQQGDVPEELQRRWEALAPVRHAILAGIGLDRCRMAISGGAPVPAEIVLFFNALGLPMAEGWGMTELTGTGTRMGPRGVRVGTAGVPLPGVEMRLAEDGELLVRGGNVMVGYYRDQAATAEAIDADGWLHTGDLAHIEEDGHLRIVGRKKELIITAGGKNVSPSNVESLIEEHPLVANACVIGDGRPYLTALVTLELDAAAEWKGQRADAPPSLEGLAADAEVAAEVARGIEGANARLSRPEQVRTFRLLPDAWTVTGGELTPTLKTRRDVILARYADVIEELYAPEAATSTGTRPAAL